MPSVSSEVVSSESRQALLLLLAVRESERGKTGHENKAVGSFHGVRLHFWRARVGAAVCKIPPRKYYIKSLPSVPKDKTLFLSGLLYSCLLFVLQK